MLLHACILVAACSVRLLNAADSRPLVGTGATRDEVVRTYGAPSGQSISGAKEVLTYPQGRVFLENGRVERVDFSTNVPWSTPSPRTGVPLEPVVPKSDSPVTAGSASTEARSQTASGATGGVQPGATEAAAPPAVTKSLWSARGLVSSAAVAGVSFAAIMFWVLWRKGGRQAPAEGSRAPSMATRISDAARGLPAPADLKLWPREKMCAVVAGLGESDGYLARVLATGSGRDVELTRPGESRPCIFVCCTESAKGPVPAKLLRKLLEKMTEENVETGWFVSPAGFAADAPAYAERRNLLLIDGESLIARLRDMPPALLPKVLARV
jgi:hypothetical protein